MKPYYEDDLITIYNCPCMMLLPHLPKIDLCLTDPPYGLNWEDTGFTKKNILERNLDTVNDWDNIPDKLTFDTIKQISNSYIIWGGNYIANILGNCKAPFIWYKRTGNNPFADAEIAWTSFPTGTARVFDHQWCGAFRDSERGESYHPTQKPVALMSWCITQALKHSAVTRIIDPFMGSGSTLRAAKNLGIKAIGMEIKEEYCEIAAKRMAQTVMELGI